MTLLSFASWKSFAQPPQTAASPTAQISAAPMPEEWDLPLPQQEMNGPVSILLTPGRESITQLYDRFLRRSETDSAAAEIAQRRNDPAARNFLASKLPSLIIDQLPTDGPPSASPVWLNAVRLAGQLKLEAAIPALKLGLSRPDLGGGYDNKYHGASTTTIEAKLAYDIVGRALADIGDPSVPVLAEILSTGDSTARKRVTWILINIDSPASRKAMRDHFPHERDSIVRELIGRTLHLPVAYTKHRTIWLDGTRPQ
jgi:hypothetical protein